MQSPSESTGFKPEGSVEITMTVTRETEVDLIVAGWVDYHGPNDLRVAVEDIWRDLAGRREPWTGKLTRRELDDAEHDIRCAFVEASMRGAR